MAEAPSQFRFRVRVVESVWRAFKQRAGQRGIGAATYADMVFRYLLHDPVRLEAPPERMDDLEEPVYFELELPAGTRDHLVAWSARERANMATFGGQTLQAFLARFPRDPRDLATLHYLSTRLDEMGALEEEDVQEAVRRCEHNPSVRLPPGALSQWLHGRIRLVIDSVRRSGVVTGLTLPVLEEILRE